jgi:transcriptional regulator with XRE-family HTH domain
MRTAAARPNLLRKLILARKDELRLTYHEIAARGGFSSHSVVAMLAQKQELRAMPRTDTIAGLARALEVPVDVVREAAAASAGYGVEGLTTTLDASEDVRLVVSIMDGLPPADRRRVRRLIEAYVRE